MYNSREELLALWCHETCRVVADRMWDPADVAWVKKQLADRLAGSLGSSWEALFEANGGEASCWQCLLRCGTRAALRARPVTDTVVGSRGS